MLKNLINTVKRFNARRRIRKINKDLFIKLVERRLIAEHKEKEGVYIPEFYEARQVYEDFRRNNCFDENGYLIPAKVGY